MAASFLSAAGRRLEGKVALITGGASGIGEHTAKLFTQHGAKVMIADIQDTLGQELCKHLPISQASYIHCDVTNETHVQNAVDTTISTFGQLDIMFNNAGTVIDPLKPSILDTKLSDFNRVINTNLIGPFLGTKHAARVMIPAQKGTIITTASSCSVIGGLSTHAYTSSKHGVVGLVKNSAVELGKYGIRVNCVSPHAIYTPLAKRFFEDQDVYESMYSNMKGECCKVEDVGNAVLFLACEDSKYVNGVNLVVDGGCSITDSAVSVFK